MRRRDGGNQESTQAIRRFYLTDNGIRLSLPEKETMKEHL